MTNRQSTPESTMNLATIQQHLVELTAAIATAAALVLTAMPVQAQSVRPREIDRAQAERLGLTLPCPRNQASGAEVDRARDRFNADFQRARASGERAPFQAERYGLTLPQPARQNQEATQSAGTPEPIVTAQASGG
jgi:hypothetical protein